MSESGALFALFHLAPMLSDDGQVTVADSLLGEAPLLSCEVVETLCVITSTTCRISPDSALIVSNPGVDR